MPRPTGRGYALLALAVITYLAARLVGTWELYLLSFAFLAVVVLSWLLVTVAGRRIRVTRSFSPDRPVAGDEPEIVSLVENASLLPGPQLTLRNHLAGLAHGDLELEVESLAPRGRKSLRAHVGLVNRGVHFLPAAQAIAEDPLGVARAVHKASDALVVTVLPRIAFLDSCALHPGIGLKQDWTGRHGVRGFGASEFRGVRPHQPGEPLSHIDWKSTAKTGTLMLREMEDPAGADVTLLLDGTAAEVSGEPPDSNFELAVRAAGSIADFVLRAGRGVSLLCHERNWRQERLTADGAGRRALLQALAETRPDASAPLTNALRHLRTGGPRLLRAESVTIVSISLNQQLARALIDLRAEGVRLAFLYLVGTSFGGTAPEAISYLLPFLPPRPKGRAAPDGAAPLDLVSAEVPPGVPAVAHAGSTLPADLRALLLSLSASGIPCQTLSRGEDIVRHLSLWQPTRRSAAVAR
jgi:uncharacterized protein (DUF58 family)